MIFRLRSWATNPRISKTKKLRILRLAMLEIVSMKFVETVPYRDEVRDMMVKLVLGHPVEVEEILTNIATRAGTSMSILKFEEYLIESLSGTSPMPIRNSSLQICADMMGFVNLLNRKPIRDEYGWNFLNSLIGSLSK